jgi:N-acetylneuraminate synthase
MYGSDARHSLEPSELADLVQGIRAIEVMLSSQVNKDDIGPYMKMKRIFEKSLVANVNIPRGTVLTRDLVGIKKPGTGISASRLSEFLGKTVRKNIPNGELLREDDFE